ncbi:MAG: signal peptidase II [Lachnospiraceae bacterium]|nr:signal peptidase II [Lachnospiraceae bacterium]
MLFVTLVLLLAAVDLGLKWLIERQEAETFPRPLEHTNKKIMLYQNHNAGFPFGFLEKYGELVRVFPLVVISALGGVLGYLIPRRGHIGEKLGLAVILGGALSNLYDRYVRRYVVDYFSVQIGALKKVVFNLGDIFVFLGTGILLFLEIWTEIREKFHNR